MARWTLKRNGADIKRMAEDLNISEIFACVLANRKIFTRKDAELYIKPRIALMNDTFLMKDVEKAVLIIFDSVRNNDKIFVYGDYDVDGVTSTVILYKALKNFGADAEYYIPDRRSEGYGLNKEAILKIKNMGCDVIFTCDNGIAALEEAQYIKELGMKLIVLDHHEPGFTDDEVKNDILPVADAVIDAKQKNCRYPFKALCAGGMAYKFAKALFSYAECDFENEAEAFIFAAIATVCDIVDLCGENRIIVKNGLRLINSKKNTNAGLRALIRCRGIEGRNISEENIGFIIGPCINAAGRLEKAVSAVELFLEEDEEKALAAAEKLSALNDERKRLTAESIERIIENIEKGDFKDDRVLVIYDEHVDESIVGIVAGKIKERYYKPVILITKGEECDKGSARSIESYNIFENLHMNRDLFERFGGHSMAAGLSLKHENVQVLRNRLNKSCTLTEKDMTEVIRIDKELKFSDVNIELAEEMQTMRPFGKANKEALFATKNVIIDRVNFVGSKKEIMQFVFLDSESIALKGISFDGFQKFKDYAEKNYSQQDFEDILSGNLKNINLCVDIVYSVDINEYNNIRNVQLKVKDFRFI